MPIYQLVKQPNTKHQRQNSLVKKPNILLFTRPSIVTLKNSRKKFNLIPEKSKRKRTLMSSKKIYAGEKD
jgi:hypothetical protein